jgi:hypothetical protein
MVMQARRVRRGLHQHGDRQVGGSQRVGNGALVAEIGQCDNDAVDLMAVFAKQFRKLGSLGEALDGAVPGFLRSDGNHVVAGLLERLDHFAAPALRQMTGKEPAVSDDQTKSHLTSGAAHINFSQAGT